MIDSTSRYSNVPVQIDSSTGTPRQVLLWPQPVIGEFRITEYQLKENDTIDSLAFNLLGDARQWWRIADLNPEILLWVDIPVGTIIRLPS